MISLKEFQNSEIGKSLSINEMVNIKGGYAIAEGTATGASALGGECLGSFGCATWTADYQDCGTGCMSYDNLHLLGSSVPC
jgi:hypothetical protein